MEFKVKGGVLNIINGESKYLKKIIIFVRNVKENLVERINYTLII